MDFDAVLLLSFGGPEGPEQVRPFLENVTRGRDIPPERLDDVAEHYLHFGGVSPINGINRALIDAAAATGPRPDLPVYFGNRNWEPYVEDTVAPCATTGFAARRCSPRRRGAATPAARSTVEDIARARRRGGTRRARTGQAAASTSTTRCSSRCSPTRIARRRRDAARGAAGGARLVFTAHSIPIARRSRAAARTSTAARSPTPRRLVAAAAGYDDYDQVWQSRSGPPQVPWLEPDVGDHLAALARGGHQGGDRLSRSVSSPTTSRWCGISTTNCASRPTRRASRSRAPPTPNAEPRFAAAGRGPHRRAARRPRRPPGSSARIRVQGCGFSVDGRAVHGLAARACADDRGRRSAPARPSAGSR